jgi:hypothetical protein
MKIHGQQISGLKHNKSRREKKGERYLKRKEKKKKKENRNLYVAICSDFQSIVNIFP